MRGTCARVVRFLRDAPLFVGRKEECDVRLQHKSISKMHCVIVKTDGLLLLRDLGSTNGTRVNSYKLEANQPYKLSDNDEIEFGQLRLSVKIVGPLGR